MKKCFSVWSIVAVTVAAGACTKSSPSVPTSTASASATTEAVSAVTTNGITLTSPQALTPAVGQRFKFAEQPLTLTVKNAVTTGTTALTYSFQVATDANFPNVVFSRDNVAEGASGQTSTQMTKVTGDKDYFWRARTASGSAVGPYTAGRAFNIGPEVVIQAPTPTSPANNGNMGGTALLVVTNASRTGPA